MDDGVYRKILYGGKWKELYSSAQNWLLMPMVPFVLSLVRIFGVEGIWSDHSGSTLDLALYKYLNK